MYIYKVTNKINNKIYIGKTMRSTKERWSRHVNDATTNRLDTHLARAIRKYGAEAFLVETIDRAEIKEDLSRKEREWISKYQSDKYGYNMTSGGDGDNTYLRKTAEEMDEIRHKIRDTKLGHKNPHSRSCKCRNIKTGEELFFATVKECMEYFNESNHNFITRRCLRKISYLYQGEWQIAYADEEYNPDYSTYKSSRRGRRVKIVDVLTSTTQVFYCYAEAERMLGVPRKFLVSIISKHGNLPWIKDHYIIIPVE